MDEEIKSTLKSDLKYLGMILVVMFVFFKVHYYKESLVILLKLLVAHFYLFIIPGYALTLYYVGELKFFERFFIGLGIGYGVQPLILYLINVVVEVRILKYNKIVSLLMIVLGLTIFYLTKIRKGPTHQIQTEQTASE